MQDLSHAVTPAPVATTRWILNHAVSMKIPGLGMELTRKSREGLRRLDSVNWLLGHDAQKQVTLLFVKGDAAASFVGFGSANDADVTTTLSALGIEPNAIMPDGQHRYGMDALQMLERIAVKHEAMGKV